MINGDFNLRTNQDYRHAFRFITLTTGQPIVLTGSTFKMELRSAAGEAVAYSMTTANDRIVSTDLADGRIELVFEAGEIAAGEYLWDLIRVNGGDNEVLGEGRVTVTAGITQ